MILLVTVKLLPPGHVTKLFSTQGLQNKKRTWTKRHTFKQRQAILVFLKPSNHSNRIKRLNDKEVKEVYYIIWHAYLWILGVVYFHSQLLYPW